MPGRGVSRNWASPAATFIDWPSGEVTLDGGACVGNDTGEPTTMPESFCTDPPAASSKLLTSGTHLLETASWLSSGCQPLVNAHTRPVPLVRSKSHGSPLSNRATTFV